MINVADKEENGGRKMVYEIYEGLFEKVEKKLNRIAKKCAKFGNPFTFEVVGDTIKEGKDNVYY